MKFTYQYRTSDNAKHKGVVVASSRDEAFALLKARGVKAFGVEEAPGFFNKLFGKGKRWIAIGVLLAACLVLCALTIDFSHEARSTRSEAREALSLLDSTVRRYPLGDAATIETGIRTGWSSYFPDEGDQFLASFAIPGAVAAKRNVSESALAASLARIGKESSRELPLEARQVGSIVQGMKTEINALLGQGWTLKEVGTALAKRQDQEIACYNRVKTELDAAEEAGELSAAELSALYEKRNAALRKLGIRSIPMPE